MLKPWLALSVINPSIDCNSSPFGRNSSLKQSSVIVDTSDPVSSKHVTGCPPIHTVSNGRFPTVFAINSANVNLEPSKYSPTARFPAVGDCSFPEPQHCFPGIVLLLLHPKHNQTEFHLSDPYQAQHPFHLS